MPQRQFPAQKTRPRAARQSASFAFLLLDGDHFKKVNDVHGHLTGDALLRHVGAVLTANKRTEDVLARIGGNEFLLLLMVRPRHRCESGASA